MTTRSAAVLALLLIPGFWTASASRVSASECNHCPKTVFCRPKPPCIKYHNVCPKPVCPCGEMENFGYYPTCWRPWPFPPNYSHCPCPPTSVTAPCAPNGAPNFAAMEQQLPLPARLPQGQLPQ